MQMSKVDELIEQLCPEGVERKTLGELGKFYGGLTGKSKDDFTDGNAKFVTYKNVYSNPALNLHPEETVKIAEGEKQRTLKYGDIIFTGSSETPDECGFASVVTEEPDEDLYLNSFCFFLRMDDTSILNPDFAKHLFRSRDLRVQIGKTASGVTRFNVSKKLMEKVTIPIPPLPVQEEIVRILDNFTELTAELQAELQARAKQYEYYRENLLIFQKDAPMVKVGDICKVFTGGEAPDDCIKGDMPDEEHPYAVWGNGKDVYGYSGSYKIDKDAVVISSIGANTGTVYFHKAFFTPIIRLKVLIPLDENTLNMRYLFHALSARKIESKSSSVPNMNANEIKQLQILLPDIKEQKRIADILDRFEKICADVDEGLPAEIDARQKQYEYYRNKLLTFKEVGEGA
jgi:type I restriction enzyme S subunit